MAKKKDDKKAVQTESEMIEEVSNMTFDVPETNGEFDKAGELIEELAEVGPEESLDESIKQGISDGPLVDAEFDDAMPEIDHSGDPEESMQGLEHIGPILADINAQKEYSKRWIKVDFTEEEISEFAKDLVGKLQDIEKNKNDIADFTSRRKAVIKSLELEVAELARKVRDRSEMDNVRCRKVKHYISNMVYFFNEDPNGFISGDPVDSRAMKRDEYQREIGETTIDGVVSGG